MPIGVFAEGKLEFVRKANLSLFRRSIVVGTEGHLEFLHTHLNFKHTNSILLISWPLSPKEQGQEEQVYPLKNLLI